MRNRLLLLGALAWSLLAACGAEGGQEAVDDDGPVCEFEGEAGIQRVNPVGGPFTIVDVRHEVVRPGCEERLVFVLESIPDDGQPGYNILYRDAVYGPSGQIEVESEALLQVILLEAFGGEARRAADAQVVVDIVKPPEEPGGSMWLVGLEQRNPFTVTLERTPEPSLVVTIGVSSSETG